MQRLRLQYLRSIQSSQISFERRNEYLQVCIFVNLFTSISMLEWIELFTSTEWPLKNWKSINYILYFQIKIKN